MVIAVFLVLLFQAHKVLVTRQKPNHSSCSLISSPVVDQEYNRRLVPVVQSSRGCCVCWSMLIKKVTSTITTKKEELFSCPLWNGDLKAGGRSWCLEELAWRKACDCLCNVIVIMVGQGIAVVQ